MQPFFRDTSLSRGLQGLVSFESPSSVANAALIAKMVVVRMDGTFGVLTCPG